MPVIVNFILSENDYKSLLIFIKRNRAPIQEIKRAEVLLLLHNQVPAKDIYKMFGITESTSRRIRENYVKEGLKRALYDAYRSGKPPKFTHTDRTKITALACSEAPEGHAKWSLSLLADKLIELKYTESISKAQVGRILKKTK